MKHIRKKLRDMLDSGKIIVAPGVYAALPAIIAQNVGFKAVYMSGYTTSAFLYGMPDLGLITMSEMANNVSRICDAVELPVIADCDNGYGNALNVIRSVKEYEKAGASAIQLEDQIFPKKCGHMSGKEVIKTDDMLNKIKAALDTRNDDNLLIIARTDSRAVIGFEEAIDRSNKFAEIGADIIFLESPVSKEEISKIPKLISKPVMANMVEAGQTPLYSNNELEDLGYSLVIWPGSSAWSTAKAVTKTMYELKDKNTTKDIIENDMISWENFNNLIGVPKYTDLSQKYQS